MRSALRPHINRLSPPTPHNNNSSQRTLLADGWGPGLIPAPFCCSVSRGKSRSTTSGGLAQNRRFAIARYWSSAFAQAVQDAISELPIHQQVKELGPCVRGVGLVQAFPGPFRSSRRLRCTSYIRLSRVAPDLDSQGFIAPHDHTNQRTHLLQS